MPEKLQTPMVKLVSDGRRSHSLKIRRDDVPRAKKYEIEFNSKDVRKFDKSEKTFANLKANTRYGIRVRAYQGSNKSAWSKTLIAYTRPESPSNLVLANTDSARGAESVSITWKASAKPADYEVEVNGVPFQFSTSKGFLKLLAKQFGFSQNQKLEIRLRTLNLKRGDQSVWSHQLITVTRPFPPMELASSRISAHNFGAGIFWLSKGKKSWLMQTQIEESTGQGFAESVLHDRNDDQLQTVVDHQVFPGTSKKYTLVNVVPRKRVPNDLLKGNNLSVAVELEVDLNPVFAGILDPLFSAQDRPIHENQSGLTDMGVQPRFPFDL